MSTRLLSKNKPHPLRINKELRDPRVFGPQMSPDEKRLRYHMPLLMHGEKVQYIENRTGKHNVPSKYVKYPQVFISSFYSRVLDMKIMCRVSKSALWMIEQEFGGFDEYFMTAPEEYFKDYVAQMYRIEIRQAFEEKKSAIRKETMDLLARYGSEYIKKLQGYEWKMDNVMLKELDAVIEKKTKKVHPIKSGLLPEFVKADKPTKKDPYVVY